MYPCIEINTNSILNNLNVLRKKCSEKNISLTLISKVLAGNTAVLKLILEKGNVSSIGDSRVKNLKIFKDFNVEKWLIRSPMLSEVDDVVKYSDISLNTELSVITALNEAAVKQNKKHKIVLMYECGDLREGCYYNELAQIIEETFKMEGIELYGIGTNLSCLNDTIPTEKNMKDFIDVVNRLEEKFDIKFKFISGGASSSINMLFDNKLPSEINHIRTGEGVFLGNVPVYDNAFPDAIKDCFKLKAEIIELKSKPDIPETAPENANELRRRAVLALGKQDVYFAGLSCFDEKIKIIGASSDHIVVDVTNCDKKYKVGDIIDLRMNYNCLLSAMNSDYNEKIII